MTIEQFDKKYKTMGGIKMLNQFRSELKTRNFIAQHFKVTDERVRQWFKEFYKEEFHVVIPKRAQRRLELMLEMAPKMTEREWKDAFYYEENIDEALALLNQRGIVFNTQKQ